MKTQVYRCLKTLEAYKVGLMNMWANGYLDSAYSLQQQYSKICQELKNHLSAEEFAMVQVVKHVDFSKDWVYPDKVKADLVNELVVAAEMTLAYLKSLDMDLSREIAKKEMDLNRREDGLKIKEGEVESMKKIYGELVNIKRGLPELIRSEVTKEIKKTHREIEKHTNPNTRSQQKNPQL